MAKKKDNTLWIVLGVIIVLIILVGGGLLYSKQKCVGEFKQITTGVALQYQKECCSGLVLKAPRGFTGGAWCVKPEIDVVCLSPAKGEVCISCEEGIYAKSRPDIRPSTEKLLKEQTCW